MNHKATEMCSKGHLLKICSINTPFHTDLERGRADYGFFLKEPEP